VHGLGGSPGDFEPFGARLAAEGYCCFAASLRGQGLDPDPRRRGSFLDSSVLEAEIAAFATEMLADDPDAPAFFCGESLGALLGARLFANGSIPRPFSGLIFSAPVVALRRETPRPVKMALRFLARVAPDGRIRPSWFVTQGPRAPKTSRDDAWIARQKQGPQYIEAFSFGTFHAVGCLMEEMPAAAGGIRLPSLVLAAGRDVFVRTEQIRNWFDLVAAEDKTFVEFPDAHHVLWNDWDRESVLDTIAGWMRTRLESPASVAAMS
jgi:lysophospholipase